jgi:hypothetical protein
LRNENSTIVDSNTQSSEASAKEDTSAISPLRLERQKTGPILTDDPRRGKTTGKFPSIEFLAR